MAKKIGGIAIFPRESRNKIFYHTEELEKFHNISVPLRHDHDQSPEAIIGSAHFTYDEEKQQVLYTAEITDPEWQNIIDNVHFQVSIGATVLQQSEMCDTRDLGRSCLDAPVLASIDELSLVQTPKIT